MQLFISSICVLPVLSLRGSASALLHFKAHCPFSSLSFHATRTQMQVHRNANSHTHTQAHAPTKRAAGGHALGLRGTDVAWVCLGHTHAPHLLNGIAVAVDLQASAGMWARACAIAAWQRKMKRLPGGKRGHAGKGMRHRCMAVQNTEAACRQVHTGKGACQGCRSSLHCCCALAGKPQVQAGKVCDRGLHRISRGHDPHAPTGTCTPGPHFTCTQPAETRTT